jgi:hypothetical protein
MSSFRKMAFATVAIGGGLAAMGAIPSASAEQMMWWELGVTPSYGYGDDYPQRPREAHARWTRHAGYNEARARVRP